MVVVTAVLHWRRKEEEEVEEVGVEVEAKSQLTQISITVQSKPPPARPRAVLVACSGSSNHSIAWLFG